MECLFYTDAIISDQRTLTKLCLLFDTVRTLYLSPAYYLKPLEERWVQEKNLPFFAKSPCEKDLMSSLYARNWKRFIDDNRELIDSNVLQPIFVEQTPPDWESFETYEKKLMSKAYGIAYGLWGQSVGLVPNDVIYVDAPWYSLYRWQSIAGGLYFAIRTGHIPISDNTALSHLAIDTVNRFSDLKHQPTKDEIYSHVAFSAMSMLVPNFPALQPNQILEARSKLSDELRYFRYEIQHIADNINEDAYSDITSIVTDKIQPRLDDLKLKIKSLDNELFRNIAGTIFAAGGATPILSYLLDMPLGGQVATMISFFGKIIIDIHKNQSKRSELRSESSNRGLVFLLDVQKYR